MLAERLPLFVMLLSGAAAAQQSSPLNTSVHPGSPRFGGTYHLMTGKWTRSPGRQVPGPAEGARTRVYDNSCLWTGASANTLTFNGLASCEDVWDDGRIPGTGSGVAGATDDNLISAVTFGHVTFAPTGSVDVELNFYDALGGACVGSTPPNPPAPAAAGTLRLDPANGVTLPGDVNGGAGTAWIVTIDLSGGLEFCLLSEGDGTTGTGSDSFNWSFRHRNPAPLPVPSGGPIVAGEPIRGIFGACTYTIACGSDPTTGPCGTGLGTTDSYWQNVDGDPVGPGSTLNTSATCSIPAQGSGCFFFGGWPANAWASYFLQLDSAGTCATMPPPFFCAGKTGSNGCIPFLTTDAGTASVSGSGAWNIRSNDSVDGESGFLLYSFKKSNLNFHGGKLCVKTPFVRTPLAKAKQTACVDPFGQCTTTVCRQLRRNFNATVQSGSDPQLTAGKVVFAQMRQRDPTEPLGFGDNFSDGLRFTIAP